MPRPANPPARAARAVGARAARVAIALPAAAAASAVAARRLADEIEAIPTARYGADISPVAGVETQRQPQLSLVDLDRGGDDVRADANLERPPAPYTEKAAGQRSASSR